MLVRCVCEILIGSFGVQYELLRSAVMKKVSPAMFPK